MYQFLNFFRQWFYRRNIVSPAREQVKREMLINYTNAHKKTRFHRLKTGFWLYVLGSDSNDGNNYASTQVDVILRYLS